MLIITTTVCFAIPTVSANDSQKTLQDIPPELEDQIPPELRDRAIVLNNNSFGISGPLTEEDRLLLEEYQRNANEKNNKGFFERIMEEISIFLKKLHPKINHPA